MLVDPRAPLDADAVPVPLAIFGRAGAVRANAAAQELFGASADGDLVSCLAPDDRERFCEWLRGVARLDGDGELLDAVEVLLDEEPPARQVACRARRSGDQVVVSFVDVSERERLRVTADEMFLGVAISARDGTMTWRHHRRDEPETVVEESVGAHVLSRVHPDDHDKCMGVLDALADEPGGRRSMVLRIRPPGMEGAWFPLRFTSVALHHEPLIGGVLSAWTPSGAPIQGPDSGHKGLAWDVIEATTEGVALFDATGQLRYRNRRVRTLLGEDAGLDGVDSLVGAVDPEHVDQVLEAVHSGLAGLGGQFVVRATVDDVERWLRLTAVPDTSTDGVALGVVVTLQDISDEVRATEELRQARDELWHLAHHDQLTGLANRALLLDDLDEALASPPAGGVQLLAVDLDGFKQVNDQHGHLAGDAVLVEVAGALRRAVGEAGQVARWGGDEFLVLVRPPDAPGAIGGNGAARPTAEVRDAELADLAHRIRHEVEEATAAAGWSVGCSVGAATARPGDDATALLRRVDEAMYAQKATRRRRRTDG